MKRGNWHRHLKNQILGDRIELVLKLNVKYKAGLVAQGYSKTQTVDYEEVFSSVARHSSISTLLAPGSSRRSEFRNTDIT